MSNPVVAAHPIFELEVFNTLGNHAEAFASARPFKHMVIDGLFRVDMLRAVAAEYYPPEDPRWNRFKDKSREVKLGMNREGDLPARVRELTRELNSEPFLRKLTELTGIEGLIPDPYLEGGGMHQIVRGGKLAIHADFNRQQYMQLDRRLNVLVYLNEDWDEAWGGKLELWDREMKACEAAIAPHFNRMVVFLTDDYSYHGHPDPLDCPPDRTRKSVAMYYYTNGRPEQELSGDAHSTLFKERPEETFAPKLPEEHGAAHHAFMLVRSLVPSGLRPRLKKLLGRK